MLHERRLQRWRPGGCWLRGCSRRRCRVLLARLEEALPSRLTMGYGVLVTRVDGMPHGRASRQERNLLVWQLPNCSIGILGF